MTERTPTERTVTAAMPRITLRMNGAVAVLTLQRAPMNILDDAMLHAIDGALDSLEANRKLRVLRIRSNQRAFSAGADLHMVAGRAGRAAGASAMMQSARLFHRTFDRIAALKVVTLAEVEGHALGGGLELALACDLRIASHNARLGLPETKMGLLPGAGGIQRLTRLCGVGVAARLILTGETLDGREAERIGLVQWATHIVDFSEAADDIAGRISTFPAAALQAAKASIGLAGRYADETGEADVAALGALMRAPGTGRRVAAVLRK